MTEMEYENYCEMLSVMDRPIKMKTVTLSSDIVDGKQRQNIDWNSIDLRKKYFEICNGKRKQNQIFNGK